jgi:hypothetical protein
MEICFNMTLAQQAADDARAKAYQEAQEARIRQTARNLSPEAFKATLADLTRQKRRAAPAPGPHVSTLTDAEAARELRRLGVRSRG